MLTKKSDSTRLGLGISVVGGIPARVSCIEKQIGLYG